MLSVVNGRKPVIITPQGPVLSTEEADLYAAHKPAGFILFKNHCENPTQLKQLIADLKNTVGADCIISVDQEGGRVARLRGPHWPEFPAPANMGDPYQDYLAIGSMLAAEGFNVDYAPCLDVIPTGGRSDAIGDRCLSSDPTLCGQQGMQACKGLLEAGIMPVIKHMPGHGRAEEDSHYHLPVVKASEDDLLKDLAAFQLNASDMVAGMTAHVIYECWDKERPATLSKTIISDIIRNKIGFKGLLFSDDLAMKALEPYGDMLERVHMALEAGCDIALPCHITMDQSKAILESF